MSAFGSHLNKHLNKLDTDGDAYWVSIDQGDFVDVVVHTSDHLEVSVPPDGFGQSLFINLNNVRSVLVEEL